MVYRSTKNNIAVHVSPCGKGLVHKAPCTSVETNVNQTWGQLNRFDGCICNESISHIGLPRKERFNS